MPARLVAGPPWRAAWGAGPSVSGSGPAGSVWLPHGLPGTPLPESSLGEPLLGRACPRLARVTLPSGQGQGRWSRLRGAPVRPGVETALPLCGRAERSMCRKGRRPATKPSLGGKGTEGRRLLTLLQKERHVRSGRRGTAGDSRQLSARSQPGLRGTRLAQPPPSRPRPCPSRLQPCLDSSGDPGPCALALTSKPPPLCTLHTAPPRHGPATLAPVPQAGHAPLPRVSPRPLRAARGRGRFATIRAHRARAGGPGAGVRAPAHVGSSPKSVSCSPPIRACCWTWTRSVCGLCSVRSEPHGEGCVRTTCCHTLGPGQG